MVIADDPGMLFKFCGVAILIGKAKTQPLKVFEVGKSLVEISSLKWSPGVHEAVRRPNFYTKTTHFQPLTTPQSGVT